MINRITEKIIVTLGKFKFYPSVIINGRKTIVPLIGYIGLENLHCNEAWKIELFKSLLCGCNKNFIDIGVNLAQTLIQVKSINPDCAYIGFEPNPSCCAYTSEIIRINRYNNCSIIPIGLSNQASIMTLYSNENTDSSASLINGFRSAETYSHKQYVPVFEGDKVIEYLGIKSISMIKIDVEGGELEVIYGILNTIKKMRPFIMCEILPVYDSNTENGSFRLKRQLKIEELLIQCNYKIYRTLHNGNIQKMNKIGINADLNKCDYLFVPAENDCIFYQRQYCEKQKN